MVHSGWSLQELLAPTSVEFFSKEWKRLIDKQSVGQKVHKITRILSGDVRLAALFGF
jgi:hypothetical protein